MTQESRKRLLLIPAILVGVVLLLLMIKSKQPPQRLDIGERATPVRFIEVAPLDVVARATGYGSVRPARVWNAVSEVSGRVVELPERVRAGMPIAPGGLIVAIDPGDYRLALEQAQANLAATEAQLAQLDAQEANYRASLAIEQKVLASSEKELARNRKLAAKGSLSTTTLEQQERATLAQQQKVQSLQNSLDLLPADRAAKRAQRDQLTAQVRLTEQNLTRTRIEAPFQARLAEVNVEQAQYVRQGEVLAQLDSMERAEVTVQLPLVQFAQLFPAERFAQLEQQPQQLRPAHLGLSARVEMAGDGLGEPWPARFARLDAGVDAKTRTVGVVVEIDRPYADAKPPLRPPLVKGRYVQLTLQGPVHAQQLVIPRSALHGDRVYLLDADNRLQSRTVQLRLRQPGFVSVVAGLEGGERLIVSDLVPAVEGMLLEPRRDKESEQRLRNLTQAEEPQA